MYGVAAIFFEEKRKARDTLTALKAAEPQSFWVDDLVEIRSDPKGATTIDRVYCDITAKDANSVDWGAATFYAIRDFIRSPSSIPPASGNPTQVEVHSSYTPENAPPSFAQAFLEALQVKPSAIALVGQNTTLDEFLSETEPFGAMIIRGDLSEQEIEILRPQN